VTAHLLFLLLVLQSGRMDLTEVSVKLLTPTTCISCAKPFSETIETRSGDICIPDWKRLTGHDWNDHLGSWEKKGGTTREPGIPVMRNPITGRRPSLCERWFGWLARAFR
jgi:hypothetical protein